MLSLAAFFHSFLLGIYPFLRMQLTLASIAYQTSPASPHPYSPSQLHCSRSCCICRTVSFSREFRRCLCFRFAVHPPCINMYCLRFHAALYLPVHSTRRRSRQIDARVFWSGNPPISQHVVPFAVVPPFVHLRGLTTRPIDLGDRSVRDQQVKRSVAVMACDGGSRHRKVECRGCLLWAFDTPSDVESLERTISATIGSILNLNILVVRTRVLARYGTL